MVVTLSSWPLCGALNGQDSRDQLRQGHHNRLPTLHVVQNAAKPWYCELPARDPTRDSNSGAVLIIRIAEVRGRSGRRTIRRLLPVLPIRRIRRIIVRVHDARSPTQSGGFGNAFSSPSFLTPSMARGPYNSPSVVMVYVVTPVTPRPMPSLVRQRTSNWLPRSSPKPS